MAFVTGEGAAAADVEGAPLPTTAAGTAGAESGTAVGFEAEGEARATPSFSEEPSADGMLPPRGGGEGSGPAGRQLCHAWLDRLFRELHADLQALLRWDEEEAAEGDGAGGDEAAPAAAPDAGAAVAIAPAGGGAAAGGAEAEATATSTGTPGAEAGKAGAPPSAGYLPWLHRASLAVRLDKPPRARVAYTRAIQGLEAALDGVGQQPLQGVARAAAEGAWSQACTTLLGLHAQCDEPASLAEALAAAQRILDAAPSPHAPREVVAAVYQLVATHGLQRVRAAQRTLGEPHPALNHTFHEVVQWQVRGFDR